MSLALLIPFWPSFQVPCEKPERGMSDDQRRDESKRLVKELEKLRKQLTKAELELPRLRENLKQSIVSPLHLQATTVVEPIFDIGDDDPIADLPIDQLHFQVPKKTTPKAAGRDATALAKCHTKIIKLKEQIHALATQEERA